MRQDILDRIQTKIDWRKVLRYFVKTSQRADKRSTPRRLNKRYPRIHPGKRVRRQASIAISIDQSGSVDDQMLAAFFSELNKLAEIAEFTVIPFDTVVAESKVYTWKKGQSKKTERVMRGGTCFNAPTKYVNERGFDGHIVLTDLCAPKPVASKCQRMWMTTATYAARPYFSTNERIIAIDS
jgi:predicted metal-dependent peptidase